MAEDFDGALGIRATIDASDIQTSAQEWVNSLTQMQTKTNEIVGGMNENLSSLQRSVDEFGKSANGMSISELQNKLNEAKASFVETGETIQQQREIVNELKATLEDCGRAYKEAKESGNKNEIEQASEALRRVKDDYAAAKAELNGFTQQQQSTKTEIAELTKAFNEAQNSQPSFGNVVAGADSATERIETLRQSFQTFQETLASSQGAIDGLSQESANAIAAGDNGMQDVVNTITTRYIVEGADEVQAKNESVTSTIKDVEAAYTSAAATAQTAFNEQKNVVQALEAQIANLQTIMQEAVKAGDLSSASEIAAQIQTLEVNLTNAKNKLSELQAQTEQSNQKLLELGNVSNEVSQRLDSQSTTWGRVKEQIKSLRDGVMQGLDKQFESAKGAVSAFTSTIDGMGIPLSKGIAGMKSFTAASMRFIATPVGAVLGAIAIALKSVWTFLHKSAEGQMLMAKGGAFFGSIMGSVTKLLVAFGKALFKVFTSGDPIIRQFADNLVTTLKLAFSTLKNLLFGFGNLLQGVFTGDWEQMKKGAEMLGKSLVDNVKMQISAVKTLVTGTAAAVQTMNKLITDKEFTSEIASIINNMGSNAIKAYKLEAQNLALKKEEREMNERNAQLEDEIAEKYNEIYKLTGKAKDAKIEEVKALKQQLYYGKTLANGKHEAGLLDIAKKKLAITKEQNKLHSRTLQDVAKESELQIGVYKTMAAAHSSVRMLTRLQESNRRKMASAASSSAKSATKTGNAVSSGEDKLSTLEAQNILSRAELYKSLEDKITDARIQAMRDGYERTKEERDRQNTKELEDIENQRIKAVEAEKKRQKAEFDAQQAIVKAKGGKIRKWDETKDLNQEPINYINKQYEQLNQLTQQKQQRQTIDALAQVYDKTAKDQEDKKNKLRADIQTLEQELQKITDNDQRDEVERLKKNAQAQLDWLSQSKDAWNEYYQKYGTFLEKRKALEDKFLHDTQGMDENTPEFLMLKKQKEEAEATLEAEEKLKGFDWMDAFGDLSKLSDTTLENVKNQLKDIIELDKTLNASDKAKFVEKYNKASDEIEKRRESWSDYTGNNWATNIFKKKQQDKYEQQKRKDEYERAKQNYKNKIDENNTAQSEKILADENLKDKEDALNDFLQQNGSSLNADSFQGMDMSQALQMLQQNGGDFSQMGQQFKSLFSGFQGAQQGAQTAAANASQAAQAMQGAQQGMQAAQGALGGGGGAGGAAMTEAIIKGINQNVQSLNQLVKKFGNEDSGFAQGMQDFAESSQEATEAFDSFKNGDVFGTILHLSNAVEKLGSSMAKFFGYNDGEVEYQKELKRYKKMSKIWDDLIQKKKEYISLTYGDETKKAINELNALYKAEEASIRTLTKRFADKRTWNAHSQSYRNTQSINNKALELGAVKLDQSDYANTYDYLKALSGNGNYGFGAWSKASGVNISRLEDLYEKDYSYKELLALKTAANGEYYGSLSEEIQTYLDKLIEAKKAQEEFAEDMKEKLTGVKFDTMVSDFMSCLEDMNQGADDWVNSFKDKIRKAIIDNMMGTQVKEWLQDYTKRYQDAMNKGTLTDAERQQFIDEANEKSNEFFNERKELLENIGLGKSSDSGSSGGGFATASEDSVEELSGRALAANEALYSIRDIESSHSMTYEAINNGIQQMITIETGRNEYYNESIEIQRTTVSHLSAIAKNTNELYTMNERLAKIEKNTRNM